MISTQPAAPQPAKERVRTTTDEMKSRFPNRKHFSWHDLTSWYQGQNAVTEYAENATLFWRTPKYYCKWQTESDSHSQITTGAGGNIEKWATFANWTIKQQDQPAQCSDDTSMAITKPEFTEYAGGAPRQDLLKLNFWSRDCLWVSACHSILKNAIELECAMKYWRKSCDFFAFLLHPVIDVPHPASVCIYVSWKMSKHTEKRR